MKRFILTGTPGSGKTVIIRQQELEGFAVVEEAATDIIALEQARGIRKPWRNAAFIDEVANLQKQRQLRALPQQNAIQFHDRSLICTAALAVYLNYPISENLSCELDRIKRERIYQQRVFFIRNLGFIAPSEARRISFEDALRFEQIHEEIYRSHGFEIAYIEPASLEERVAVIKRLIQ